MIHKEKFQQALELAIKVIEAYGKNEGYIPKDAAKEYIALEALYLELTGNNIQ